MPYRRRRYGLKRRRGYRPRRFARRVRRRTNRSLTMRGTPLPAKFPARLKYHTNALIASSSIGLTGTYVFNAASLFDPDVTTAGHQPRGFDQIMPLYENYTVIGSKITVKFASFSSAYNSTVGIALRESTSPSTELNDYIEGRWVTHTNISAAGGTPETTLTMKYSPKMIGYNNPMSVDSLKGTATSNPSEGTFFHIFVNKMAEDGEAQVQVNITIDYLAVFTDPITPAQS